MTFWKRLWKVYNCFGWSKKLNTASQVLVSVYVQSTSMPQPGLFRSSRRFLLTTSIWSLIIVLIAFFVIYAILLSYIDQPFHHRSNKEDFYPGISVNKYRPKIRLQGKFFNPNNGSYLQLVSHRHSKFWDPKTFVNHFSEKPNCKHKSLFIVLITSSPDHFQHRKEIRKTWCSSEKVSFDERIWQCVFLIGETDDSAVSSQLRQESHKYRDILRGSYVDSYRNLTHKVMHGLAWVSLECEAPYVLKTDDDCFVNTLLIKHFLLYNNEQTTNLYTGSMVVNEAKRKVIRTPNVKWSVSKSDYAPEYYPVYASGSGYILSFDVVTLVVEKCKYIKPIPNEDAYVGIVMGHLGVMPTLSGRFTLSSNGLRLCNYKYVFVVHGITPSMHHDQYNEMITAQRECSKDEVKGWF